MRVRIDSDQFAPIAAVALMLLSLGACAFQLRNDEDGEAVSSPVFEEIDPFAAKLRRCQTVTPEQAAELEACRQVWAQNRRRFMTSTKPNWSTAPETDPINPVPVTKYPDRIVPLPNNQPIETR